MIWCARLRTVCPRVDPIKETLSQKDLNSRFFLAYVVLQCIS